MLTLLVLSENNKMNDRLVCLVSGKPGFDPRSGVIKDIISAHGCGDSIYIYLNLCIVVRINDTGSTGCLPMTIYIYIYICV